MWTHTSLFNRYGDLDAAIDHTDAIPDEFGHLDAMALIGKELYRRFGEEVAPEINLILAIMQSAASSKDADYFGSENFTYHCAILGLDAEDMLEKIARKKLLEQNVYKIDAIKKYKDVIKFQHQVEGYSYAELGIKYNVCTKTIRNLFKHRGISNK